MMNENMTNKIDKLENQISDAIGIKAIVDSVIRYKEKLNLIICPQHNSKNINPLLGYRRW